MPRKRVRPLRYYLNPSARKKGHRLKEASKQVILAIVNLIKDDSDDQFFISNGAKGLRKLLKLLSGAHLDPNSDTSATSLLKGYFSQFDWGNSMKYQKWVAEHPDYDKSKWDWSIPEDSHEDFELADEADEFQINDSENYNDPVFNNTIDKNFGNISMKNSNNLDPSDEEFMAEEAEEKSDDNGEEDSDLDDNDASGVENVKKFLEFMDQIKVVYVRAQSVSSLEDLQSAKQSILGDSLKMARTLNLPWDNDLYQSFRWLYPEAELAQLERVCVATKKNVDDFLLDKGYLDSEGRILKVYEPRVNRNFGINLHTTEVGLNPLAEPPRKKQRLNPVIRSNTDPQRDNLLFQHQTTQLSNNQLISLLQTPQLQRLVQQIANSSSSTFPTSSFLQSSTGISNQGRTQQQILDQLSTLSTAIKTLQQNAKKNVPRPDLHSNPNRVQMDISVDNPYRGIRHFVQDYNKMNSIVTRIKDVIIGEEMDPEVKSPLKKLNSATNKEIVLELESMYLLCIQETATS